MVVSTKPPKKASTVGESMDAKSAVNSDEPVLELDRDTVVFSSDSANTTAFASMREVWRYRGFVAYMTKRNLRTTYTQSYLGWFWSLLNPIAEVLIYSFVFGVILQISRSVPDAPNGFSSFPHFLLSGFVVFGFYRAISSKILNGFTATVRLRRKLYFPPAAAAISSALSTIVDASILLFVVIGFFAVFGHISIHAVTLIPAALFAATMGLGVGLALSVYTSRYKDISYLYAIALRLIFYMLPLIWPIEQAAGRFESMPWIEPIVTSNPFAKMIQFGRDGILYMRWPSLFDWVYLTSVSVFVLVAGWAIFARSSADVAEGL